MKISACLVTVSLIANLVLASIWLNRRSSRTLQSNPHSEGLNSQAESAISKMDRSKVETFETVAAIGSEPLTWKQLESSDLKGFIRHLRAVGCPEETVQDLVLAQVNRQHAARTRELWPDRFKTKDFWEMSSQRDQAEVKKNREMMRNEREMRKEKSALLVELLGVDPEKERRKAAGGEDFTDWQQSRVGFLPESKREAVMKFLDEFEDKMQEFHARNRGLYDGQFRAEQRQLEAERLQGLAPYLTTAELREYELRQSQLATQLSFDLRGLSLSRDQYETIFDIRKKYGDSIHNFGDIDSPERGKEAEKNQKAMKDDLAGALGPEFTKQYERSQDYSFRQLTSLAKRNDLPTDTAAKVYDFKTASEQSVKQLQENTTITGEERQKALQQVRAETQKTVKEALGEKVYNAYLRQGGWWINNLAPERPLRRAP